MNKEEIDFAVDLVANSNFKFETPDGQDPLEAFHEYIQKAMADANKVVDLEPITFSSLLSDKEDPNGIYTLTDNLQDAMSKIQGFQDGLKDGSTDFTDVAQEFDIVADSAGELNTVLDQLKVDKLVNFASGFKDAIQGLEGDELGKAQSYLENMLASFDLSNIDVSSAIQGIRSQIYSAIDSDDPHTEALQLKQADKVFSRIQDMLSSGEYDEEIMLRVAMEPGFYEMTPTEVIAAYKDMEVKVKLIADEKDIQSKLEAIESGRNLTQANQSLKQANGQDLASKDYDDLISWSEQAIEQYNRTVDNINEKTWLSAEEKNKQLAEAQSNILSEQQQIIENTRSQAELPLTGLQNQLTSMQSDASAISNDISAKQAKNQKVTLNDYKKQIKNGREQLKLMLKQRAELMKLRDAAKMDNRTADMREYQSQLDSVNSSIHQMDESLLGWSNSLNTLALDNITSMSSAVSQALSEIQSETGLTTDTINNLQTAFSDLSGMDVASLFYRTADGVKVNTEYMRQLTEAEYQKQNADLQAQITAAQNNGEMERANTLLLEQSQLYAQYAATMEQFNGLSKIQAAESTKNAGANYDTMVSKIKSAQELYEKGLFGTDEFKAYSQYFSATGDTDANVWAENFARAERYITEDSTGVINFLNDLESKGYAAYKTLDDGSESWVLNLADMNQAAQDMGMSYDWFVDELSKTKDYNLPTNFVTSLQDGDQQLNALKHDLADAKSELAQMELKGVDEQTIQNQRNRISDLQSDIGMVTEAQDNWVINSKKDYAQNLANADQYIAKMKQNWKEARDDQEKAEILRATNQNLSKIGMSVDEDFGYDTEAYQARTATLPEELFYGWDTLKEKASETGDEIGTALSELHEADPSGIESITEALHGLTADELKGIDLFDNDYGEFPEAEKALDSLVEKLGLSSDQTEDLIDWLEKAGQTKVEPDLSGLTDAELEAYEMAQNLEGSTYTINAEVTGEEGVQNLHDQIASIPAGAATTINATVNGEDAVNNLTAELAEIPDETPVELNCEVGSTAELDALNQKISELNSQGKQITLNATVQDGTDTNITIGADNSAAIQAVEEVKSTAEDADPEMKVSADTNPATSAVNSAVADFNSRSATITVGANTQPLTNAINNALSGTHTINVTANVSGLPATKSYTGTMYNGPAKASGTAYNVANLIPMSHAHAAGSGDVSISEDQESLVNELGTESIIRDGRWFMIPGGMHVEQLKRGDIVLNHKQTADLIEDGKALGNGKIVGGTRALAAGSLAYHGMPSHAGIGAGSTGGTHRTTQGLNRTGVNHPSKTSTSTGNTSGSGFSPATDNAVQETADDASNLIDWIKVRLDRLQRKTDNFLTKAEYYAKLSTKLANYKSASNNIEKQIKDSRAGAKRYRQQARKTKLDATTISKIQNGTINIQDYSEEKQQNIQEYQKWWELALQTEDQILKLKQQQKEIEQDRLDAITDAYEANQKLYESNRSLSESKVEYYTSVGRPVNSKAAKKEIRSQMKQQNKTTVSVRAEIKAYEKELKKARKIFGANSVEYKEAKVHLQELNQELYESKTAYNDLSKQIYALDLTRLEYAINTLSDFGERLAASLNLKITRDGMGAVTENDYTRQIRNNNDQILKWAKVRDTNLKELNSKKYKVGSDEYERIRAEAEKADMEIIKLAQDNEQLKDSIRELRWKPFNDLQDNITETIEEMDHLRSLMDEEQFLDDNANLTGRGYANIALIGNGMQLASQQVADYREALNKLEEERQKGIITEEEYIDLSREYMAQIRNSVNAVESYKQALVSLYEQQVKKENEILQKNIDLRKDALKRKKDYYDYDKTLKKQSKDVNNLMAQIAALEGVQNQASQAELARLKAQLRDSQETLQETVNDHEYEVRISGYDKMSDDANEALDKTLTAVKANAAKQQEVIDMMLRKIKAGYKDAATEINGLIDSTGLKIDELAQKSIDTLTSLGKVGSYQIPEASKQAQGINTTKVSDNKTSNGTGVEPIVNGATDNKKFDKNETYTASSISLNKKSVTVEVGATVKLKATASPSSVATNYTWSSSKEKVATVSGGTVTGIKAGQATITVKDTVSGKSATCSVTVG